MSQYSPTQLAVHAVLRDWFVALQDGSAEYRLPDPTYQRPEGKEPWTDERLDSLVRGLDTYVWEQRFWATGNHHKGDVESGQCWYDAGPGYERLTPAQRVAFAQDLERAVEAHREGVATPEYTTPEAPDRSDAELGRAVG